MDKSVFTLAFGLLLGIKHAFEADHIIAVSTILTENKNSLKAALVGTFWGIGHTTTLFIIGILVLLTKIAIPPFLSTVLEFGVGIMLVALGVQNLTQKNVILHAHKHTHGERKHVHPHHHQEKGNVFHAHHRSFFIGTVHGLAGSGALMLLVLSTIHSTIEGLYYILLFGIGSIVGMTMTSFIFGLPFAYWIDKSPHIEAYIRIIAGIISVLFGLYIMYQILVIPYVE